MFIYHGDVQPLQEQIQEYEEQLNEAYSNIFSGDEDKYSNKIKYLLSKESYKTDDTNIVFRNSPDNMENIVGDYHENMELLQIILRLSMLEESIAEELDRRIIQHLGFDPSSWINRSNSNKPDRINPLKGYLSRIDDCKLLSVMKEWYGIIKSDVFEDALVKSYLKQQVQKLPYKEALRRGYMKKPGEVTLLLSKPDDNYFLCYIVGDNAQNITINDQAQIIVPRAKKKKSPKIMTSFQFRINIKCAELNREYVRNMPEHLIPYIHEFNHFLNYVIPDNPIVTLANIVGYNAKVTK